MERIMTREQHSLILPVGLLIVIAAGFVLSTVMPGIPASFYLIYAVVGGVIILGIVLLAKRRIPEPLTDERIQGIAESSSWITFRVMTAIIFVVGSFLMYAFPSVVGLKLIGIGAVCTIALQALVFAVVSAVLRRTR